MARLKLYYPVDEITTNLYTTGKEWMTTDKKEYVGLFHLYTTGEAYTQPMWNPKSSLQPLQNRHCARYIGTHVK